MADWMRAHAHAPARRAGRAGGAVPVPGLGASSFVTGTVIPIDGGWAQAAPQPWDEWEASSACHHAADGSSQSAAARAFWPLVAPALTHGRGPHRESIRATGIGSESTRRLTRGEQPWRTFVTWGRACATGVVGGTTTSGGRSTTSPRTPRRRRRADPPGPSTSASRSTRPARSPAAGGSTCHLMSQTGDTQMFPAASSTRTTTSSCPCRAPPSGTRSPTCTTTTTSTTASPSSDVTVVGAFHDTIDKIAKGVAGRACCSTSPG